MQTVIPDRQVFEAAMYLFFSKPTRELAAVADESLNRLTGVPLKIGVQMRMGGGEWADPTRYQGAQTPHRAFMLSPAPLEEYAWPPMRRSCSTIVSTTRATLLCPRFKPFMNLLQAPRWSTPSAAS